MHNHIYNKNIQTVLVLHLIFSWVESEVGYNSTAMYALIKMIVVNYKLT